MMHGGGFGGMGGLGMGFGIWGLLFWVVVILAVAALIKYLFFDKGGRGD